MPLINEKRVDLLSKVEEIGLFPMLWVDESADIDEVQIQDPKNQIIKPGGREVC